MSDVRPFRFGIQGDTPPGEWIAHAKRAEVLGYDVLAVGEHVFTNLAPIPALMSAATTTSSIRLGTITLVNDFHNPVMLARDIVTLDALSGGRVEFGLGSGFLNMDYTQAGVPFSPPRVRVDRCFEATRLIKAAFRQETVDHAGEHYSVQGLRLTPKPAQRSGPPLMIGGGGHRILRFAAQEADIVSLNIRTTVEGLFDWNSISTEGIARKISWVRDAAGDRFSELELHMLIMRLEVTNDPEAAAHVVAAHFAGYSRVDLTAGEVLTSPHFLIGSEESILEALRQRRDQYGISYITVFAPVMETFAPIADLLRNNGSTK